MSIPAPFHTRTVILGRIDDLVQDLLAQLGDLTTQLSQPSQFSSSTKPGDATNERPSKRPKQQEPSEKQLVLKTFSSTPAAAQRRNVFPTKAVSGVKRFAQYMRLLEVLQLNLLRERTMTKRDVYYLSLPLFSSQQASDRAIDRLTVLLGCKDRAELGILASPRGLISGHLNLHPPQEQTVVRCEVGLSTLIPTDLNKDWTIILPCTAVEGQCEGHTVLIVEKEAVFEQLTQLQLEKVILITGKGYPSIATREISCVLAATKCVNGGGVRVGGMFDCDPYGVDIHLQYERAGVGVEWVGVDLEEFLPGEEEGEGRVGYPLVQMRNDERAKAVLLLRSEGLAQSSRARLTQMLLNGYKVEIEAAYDAVGGLGGYLTRKLKLLTQGTQSEPSSTISS